MNDKKIFVILLIIIVSSFFYFLENDFVEEEMVERKNEFTIKGVSMSPMFLGGEEILVDENYYKTNEIKRDDLVLFKHSANENYLIKIIKATDEDFLEIKDKNLIINGEIMKNSVGNIYTFQPNELKMLGLYLKDGYLPKNTIFVFGDNVGASKDSRKFGAVPEDYVVGKKI